MRLLDIYKRIRELFGRLRENEAQNDFFNERKLKIQALSLHDGYKSIIEYREIEANTAIMKLSSKDTPISDIPYRQAKHSSAISFLDFLDNMRS